jgi:glycerophosphoryl diester phosphodiesterase
MHIQGHRGARGVRPENTLPSFEAALDCDVASIETDLHLTRDGVPVLYHDPFVSAKICRRADGRDVVDPLPVRSLTLERVREYIADRNPACEHFPHQNPEPTPLAVWFAERHGISPLAIPTLADLFAFALDYAGEPGRAVGKSEAQRVSASRMVFDLELKCYPFHAGAIHDGFDPKTGGLLERSVVDAVRSAGLVGRTVVRSFDHRSVRAVRQLEPRIVGAVLVAGTAPVEPAELARAAGAEIYCPEFTFLDEATVQGLHAAGVRVMPWTVNHPSEWDRLVAWGVDGIGTDFPDRLAEHLRGR